MTTTNSPRRTRLYWRFAISTFAALLIVGWKDLTSAPVGERFGFPDVWIKFAILAVGTGVATGALALFIKAVRRLRGLDGPSRHL